MSLADNDLLGTEGYSTKGAHHGDANTTDYTAIGDVPQHHYQSLHDYGMLWPGTVECGFLVCSYHKRAARQWGRPQWDPLQWGPYEWDASPGTPCSGGLSSPCAE